jgi:hypothetical protein
MIGRLYKIVDLLEMLAVSPHCNIEELICRGNSLTDRVTLSRATKTRYGLEK